MSARRQALTPDLATQWAQLAHACYLEALMTQADWEAQEIAFHGGTSLRLSWSSPRYSEDLDFLLSNNVRNLHQVASRVERQIGEMVRRIDPMFQVEMRDRTKDPERMPVYMIALSHPAYVGSAKIKAEFWRTQPSYLKNYPTQLRTPQPSAGAPSPLTLHGKDMSYTDLISVASNPVPAATLETAYADKLVAFATRPFTKWRDLYDLWWIGTQTSTVLDMERVCAQFEHNITAYTPLQNLPPAQALALFLEKPQAQLEDAANPDLKNWLPPRLWQRLQGPGVTEIVSYVRHAIGSVSDHLEGSTPADADLKQTPRQRG